MRGDDLAREYETSGVYFSRAGRIERAQVVRRDQQAVGAAGPEARQRNRLTTRARKHVPRGAAEQQRRDACSMSDCQFAFAPRRILIFIVIWKRR